MYITEKEIRSQYSALMKTYDYLISKSVEIKNFWDKYNFESITFIGCGSGYCLCESAAMSARLRLHLPANAFASGDILLNFSQYKDFLKNTLIIAPSRSGSTSEVIMAINKAKADNNTPCIALSAVLDSELSKISDLSLELPWIFDESVCQTRTVTNLYTANLMLIAILKNDEDLISEIKDAIDAGEKYIEKYEPIFKEIAENYDWKKVMVLSDSELQGIGSEGAIAFTEISQVQSNYHHILDVRHGPSVLINKKTLVIMACSSENILLQIDLIKDLKLAGAIVITVSDEAENIWNSNFNITIPKYKNYAVRGIPLILAPQMISYYKALSEGINPDLPLGLDPWINLNNKE
jgi:glutamine---fructose-6-phosphate transaminase (isomerizing)